MNQIMTGLLIAFSPIIALCLIMGGLFVVYFIISFNLRFLELVERLWGGTMFLGFCSYVTPSDRWYRDEKGEWRDAQLDREKQIRPHKSKNILRKFIRITRKFYAGR